MSNSPKNSDDDWTYLSGVLDSSNNDDDLVEAPTPETTASSQPQTPLEAQIHNLVAPNPELTNIVGLRPGKVHLHGQFRQASGRYVRQGMHVTEAIFTDSSGSVRVVWFNQPYKAASLRRETDYELRGTYSLNRGRFQISNAKVRPLAEGCKPFDNKESKK